MAERRITVEIDADVRRLIEQIVQAAEVSGARLQGVLQKALAGGIKNISFEALARDMERLIRTSREFNTSIERAFAAFEQFGRQRLGGIDAVVAKTEQLRTELDKLAASSVGDALRKRFASTLAEIDEALEQSVADVFKFNQINRELIETVQKEVLQLRALRGEYIAAMRAASSSGCLISWMLSCSFRLPVIASRPFRSRSASAPRRPITIPGRAVWTSTRRRSRVRSISMRLTAARSSSRDR